MTAVRWGILGTGRMAETVAKEFAALRAEGIDLAGVASRSTDKAHAFAGRHGIPKPFGDYAKLAADPGIDAIYIATPHTEHAGNMLSAIAGGKAVLCEKPFTVNARQARIVIDAARSRGTFLMEAMWTRFLPAVSALRELIASGTIGRVQMIVGGGAFLPDRTQAHYLLDKSLAGGALLDAGVYLVSMASMLLGTPTRSQIAGSLGPSGVDEHDAMVFEHAGGAMSLLYISLRTSRAPDLEILGDTGRIHVAAPIFRPTRLTVATTDGKSSVHDYPIAGSGYGYQIREVSEGLRAGRRESAVMPLAESLSIVETMDRLRGQMGLRYDGEQG
ncbi:MAG: Gfo/Idh/MocA family protein [Steroidobacterales bacterium]